MIFSLFCFLTLFFSADTFASNCEYQAWNIAYQHRLNNPQLLFNTLGAIEPEQPGWGKTECPILKNFIGAYQSDNESCPDLKIELMDKYLLRLKGMRNFVGINAGTYLAFTPDYEPYLTLNTMASETVISEQWHHNGQLVANSTMSLVSANELTIDIMSPQVTQFCRFYKK